MLDKILTDLENKICSDVVYLDFRKAFDSVDHNILLSKLQSMGIVGQLLNWFVAYTLIIGANLLLSTVTIVRRQSRTIVHFVIKASNLVQW